MPFLSLLLLLGSTSGLRVLDNGLGLPVYGAEDNVVDFASLANDQEADLPSQVAVCSFISYNLNPPFLPFPCSMFVRFVNAFSIYVLLYILYLVHGVLLCNNRRSPYCDQLLSTSPTLWGTLDQIQFHS